MRIGFIGVGVMGQPMALNLVRAGNLLTIWNRTLSRCEILKSHGAVVAQVPRDVFATCDVIFTMLMDGDALDAVLERNHPEFAANVANRIVVNMGTMSHEYSLKLANDIRLAGGDYVEAAVSGSRGPAEKGQLVAMLAGNQAAVSQVMPLLAPMCRAWFECGEVPGGLLMKLAVNLYLITMVSGLTEAFHFAEVHHLDLHVLQAVLDAGPMASDVSRTKIRKLLENDFTVQAASVDVLKNNSLVADAARQAGAASPLLDVCHSLFTETVQLGYGAEDMVAVLRSIRERTRIYESTPRQLQWR